MIEVVARSERGRSLTTTVEARSHLLVADEPLEAGGDDLGPGPYELLLASLGSCTVMTLELYARRKGWPLERATVRLSHERRTAGERDGGIPGERIDRITQTIELEGPLSPAQRQRLLDIGSHCPVHRTLTGRVEIVDAEPEVAAADRAKVDAAVCEQTIRPAGKTGGPLRGGGDGGSRTPVQNR